MDVPTLMTAMAAHVNASGVATAFAEPPTTIEAAQLPAIVLYWDGEEDTLITPDPDGDLWEPTIRGRVYAIAKQGDTPHEFATANALITPLVALFNRARVPNAYLPGLTGHVDRLHVGRVRASLEVGYAGHDYYGADLMFSAKFHRYDDEG